MIGRNLVKGTQELCIISYKCIYIYNYLKMKKKSTGAMYRIDLVNQEGFLEEVTFALKEEVLVGDN